jgi:hypothetical protein
MKNVFVHKALKLILFISSIMLFNDIQLLYAYVGDYQSIAYLQNLSKKRLPDISYNQNTKKYLVVWEELNQQTNKWAIAGKVLNENGSVVRDVFNIYHNSAYNSNNPKVACSNSTSWMVVFEETADAGYSPDHAIWGRIIDQYGNIGNSIDVKTTDNVLRANPDVGGSWYNGTYLVVWQEQISGKYEIRGKLFTSSGVQLGTELEIGNSFPWLGYDRKKPSVNQYGPNFFVAWETHKNSLSSVDIEGRHISYGGGMNDPFTISNTGKNGEPSVAARTDTAGNFVVTWHREINPDNFDVLFATTNGLSTIYSGYVASSTGLEFRPFAAYAGLDDCFLIGYGRASGWSGNFNIIARKIYWNNGTIDFTDIEIADVSTINEGSPEATTIGGPAGKILITWDRSDSTYGELIDLYSRIYAVYPPAVLTISPTTDFVSYGNQGGPFSPSYKDYVLSNTGDIPLNWQASAKPWISLSQSQNTLAPGSSATVRVEINSNAASLPPGISEDEISFINWTSGIGDDTRSVILNINSIPLPQLPWGPSPTDGAAGYSIYSILSWYNGGGATSYDVYFGTDPTPDSSEYKGNQTGLTYNPGTLEPGTTYYWRIDAKNSSGTTTGNVWSFTTTPAPAPTIQSTSPLPAGLIGISYSQTLTASGGVLPYSWSIVSGNLPPGLSLPPSGVISGTPNSAGTYSFTVRVTGSNGQFMDKAFSLTVNAAGSLSVSPAGGWSSSGAQGGPFTPSSYSYTLSNPGTTAINWTATKSQSWVTLSLANGTLQPGASTTVAVSINSNANSLPASQTPYTGTVNFTNTTNGNGNTTRSVNLTVNAPATLSVTPAGGLTSSGNSGGPFSPSNINYTISNTGNASLGWIATPSIDWLTVSNTSGNLNPGQSTIVTVSINSLANVLSPNNYTGYVYFHNLINGIGDATKTVSLTVNAAGSLSVSPAGGWSSSGAQGGPFTPSSYSYTLSNPGTTAINWTAAKSQSWVTLSLASGTLQPNGGAATVTVSINSNANSLAASQTPYTDTVSFTNTSNGTGNASRSVNLTVNAAGSLSVSPAGGWSSSGAQGGPFTPSSYTYTLSNPGTTAINWTAAKSQSWVTLSLASGTLQPNGGTATVTVSINSNANSLSASQTPYTDTVSFTNTSNGTGNASRSVSLTVNTSETLQVTPSDGLSSFGLKGGPFNPPSMNYTLKNLSANPINWTASTNRNWFGLSATSGTLQAGASTSVTVNIITSVANGLNVDIYNGTVGFTNPANNNETKLRNVTLIVQNDAVSPTVSVSTPTTSNSYATGSALLSIAGSASDNVDVTGVSWSTDRGGSGACSGTSSWSGMASLLSGVNVVTVTARDAAGNTGTDTLTVTYTPPNIDIGVFRPSTGWWYLDLNGDLVWSGCGTDGCSFFGTSADVPATGDWDGDGVTDIGVFRPSTGRWYLDLSGDQQWSGCGADGCFYYGTTADTAVAGDWNNDGFTEIGVFRPSTGWWYLDFNGDNEWSGCAVDKCIFFGTANDKPVTGDWNNSGYSKIGVFRPSTGMWFLDVNGNGQWDGCGTDRCINFGTSGDLPVTGDWNGDGIYEVGTFRPTTGYWYLDLNGNGQWDGCGVDGCYYFGTAADLPVVGLGSGFNPVP